MVRYFAVKNMKISLLFLFFGVMIYNDFETLNIWKIHLQPYLFHKNFTINMIFYFQRVVKSIKLNQVDIR